MTILMFLLAGCSNTPADEEPQEQASHSTPESSTTTEMAAQDPPIDQPTAEPREPEPTYDFAGASFDQDDDGWMSQEEMEASLQPMIETMVWPPHYRATDDLILSMLSPDEPVTGVNEYEVGFDHMIVGLYHTCAWYKTWLDAWQEGDDELQQHALDMMSTTIAENPTTDANGRAYLASIAEKASLGDPSGVQGYVDGMCATLPFEHPASTPVAT